jgi:hypothetical protein
MNKNDLIDISKIYVKLHNLSESETNQLIDKIDTFKEENEILEFLYRGKTQSITEEIEVPKSILKQLWNYIFSEVTGGKDWNATQDSLSHLYNQVSTGVEIGSKAAAVLIIITLVIKAIKSIRQNYLTKEQTACKHLKGSQKNICILKHQIAMKRAELGVIKRGMNTCKLSKNPADCKQKLSVRLEKVKSEIIKKEVELRSLSKK